MSKQASYKDTSEFLPLRGPVAWSPFYSVRKVRLLLHSKIGEKKSVFPLSPTNPHKISTGHVAQRRAIGRRSISILLDTLRAGPVLWHSRFLVTI